MDDSQYSDEMTNVRKPSSGAEIVSPPYRERELAIGRIFDNVKRGSPLPSGLHVTLYIHLAPALYEPMEQRGESNVQTKDGELQPPCQCTKLEVADGRKRRGRVRDDSPGVGLYWPQWNTFARIALSLGEP